MLFQLILKQLAIVFLILASLPLAVTILWKLRLLPLAVSVSLPYLMGHQWASERPALVIGFVAASVLFAVLAWAFQLHRRRQERRYDEARLLATATPMYHITEDGEYILNVELD